MTTEVTIRVMMDASPEPLAPRQTIMPAATDGGGHLPALLEALLLVTPEPVSIADLAEAAETSSEAIEAALTLMEQREDRGWVIVRHQATVHLASAPRFAQQVRRLLRLERESRLSGAALETLALIAYRQPVTRAEVEALRGVDCSGVLSSLLARSLIEICGRLPTVGNPNQYATTVEFLRQFGLTSLAELPLIEELAQMSVDRVVAEYPAAARGPEPVGGEDATA